MIKYAEHNFDKKEIQSVVELIKSEPIARSKKIFDFENELKKYFQSKYVISCSNGTAALEISLRAMEIGKGDEVIVPCMSWASTATAVSIVGATPVFVDIESSFPNLCLENVKSAITKKTKAIIPVHFAGNPVNLKELKKIAKTNSIKIIEDACHAIGGNYQDNIKIGNSKYSDISCFSFHPAKNITTGEGGAISTNNYFLAKKILNIRNNGIVRPFSILKKPYYDCLQLGSNYHLTSISAALGLIQLKKLNDFIKIRRKLHAYYEKKINDDKLIEIYKHEKYSAFNLCLAKVNNKKLIMSKLLKSGIAIFFHYPILSDLTIYKKKLLKSRSTSKFPNARNYCKNAITLPLHTKLSYKQIDFIINSIKNNIK